MPSAYAPAVEPVDADHSHHVTGDRHTAVCERASEKARSTLKPVSHKAVDRGRKQSTPIMSPLSATYMPKLRDLFRRFLEPKETIDGARKKRDRIELEIIANLYVLYKNMERNGQELTSFVSSNGISKRSNRTTFHEFMLALLELNNLDLPKSTRCDWSNAICGIDFAQVHPSIPDVNEFLRRSEVPPGEDEPATGIRKAKSYAEHHPAKVKIAKESHTRALPALQKRYTYAMHEAIQRDALVVEFKDLDVLKGKESCVLLVARVDGQIRLGRRIDVDSRLMKMLSKYLK